jgi:hypothetical protein
MWQRGSQAGPHPTFAIHALIRACAPLPSPPSVRTLQEESLSKATSSLESSQAKLETAQAALETERTWLTEQQRALSNDQAMLAAWRQDQVGGTPAPGCV